MSITESFLVALFTLIMVFVVLACLFLLIKLFSFILKLFNNRAQNKSPQVITSDQTTDGPGENEFSAGELKLYNVDERTAAMIMAIVSDESGIPLSELCFKSIRLK